MCIAIICFPVDDAIDFEINLRSLIKPFFKKKLDENLYIFTEKKLKVK